MAYGGKSANDYTGEMVFLLQKLKKIWVGMHRLFQFYALQFLFKTERKNQNEYWGVGRYSKAAWH